MAWTKPVQECSPYDPSGSSGVATARRPSLGPGYAEYIAGRSCDPDHRDVHHGLTGARTRDGYVPSGPASAHPEDCSGLALPRRPELASGRSGFQGRQSFRHRLPGQTRVLPVDVPRLNKHTGQGDGGDDHEHRHFGTSAYTPSKTRINREAEQAIPFQYNDAAMRDCVSTSQVASHVRFFGESPHLQPAVERYATLNSLKVLRGADGTEDAGARPPFFPSFCLTMTSGTVYNPPC
jgi:hypothetical protein